VVEFISIEGILNKQDALMMKRILLITFSLILLCPNLYAGEDSTYSFSWLDRDKEVYVLQNRKYRKKDHFIFHAGYGKTTSGAFTNGTAIQGKIDYFFHEEYGFEFIYSSNSGEENTTAETLRGSTGTSGARPFRRITQNYMGAMFLWSPFYSKINTFNQIIYLDWIIGLGYGSLEETNNKDEVLLGTDRPDVTQSHNGPMWSFGALFYLSKMMSVKFDVNAFHYQAERVFTGSTVNGSVGDEVWTSHVDLSVLFGLRF
jgi:outer membrane beta-barrel protein